MQVILFEGIAFGISIIAFIYGIIKLYAPKTPLYFKMIISAVGCYALEELWIIVNAICGVENGTFSVRLIGVFGCFCTFLTANVRGLDQEISDGVGKNKTANAIAIIGPVLFLIVFGVYSYFAISVKTISYIIIPFIVFVPAIFDSYFELKHLIMPMDDLKLVKNVRPIAAFVLAEYVISASYLFFNKGTVELYIDVLSAVVMAMIVIFSEKGARKWKTLI